MKVKNFFVLFLTLVLFCGMIFFACNDEKVSAVVSPVVDNNMTYLKTQTLNEVFLDLEENNTEGSLHWKNGDTVLGKGENQYEWVFEPKNNKKFLTTTGKISVVAYEPIEDFDVTLKDWTYGEQASQPEALNNTGNGEVLFEYAVLGDNFYFKKQPVDAGKYVVRATVLPTEEYSRMEALSSFSILKKPLTAEMVGAVSNKIYNGNSQKSEIEIEGLINEENYVVSWTYKKDDTAEFGALPDEFISAGIYNVKINGKGNYTGEVEKSFQIFEDTMENQKMIEGQNGAASETSEQSITTDEKDASKEEQNTHAEEKKDESVKEEDKDVSSVSNDEDLEDKNEVLETEKIKTEESEIKEENKEVSASETLEKEQKEDENKTTSTNDKVEENAEEKPEEQPVEEENPVEEEKITENEKTDIVEQLK